MASLAAETQLEKDVASKAGVIPIWPWTDPITGDTKNGVPAHIYANMLLEAKRQNDEHGTIIRCSDPKCEPVGGIGNKAMFWRSDQSPLTLVPKGWTNTGGMGPYIKCPNCKAQDIQDLNLQEQRDENDYREGVDASTGHTGSTSSGNNKSLQNVPAVTTSVDATPGMEQLSVGELKAHARELWKNNPKYLKGALQAIDEEERKKRAKAAESRKRKRTEGGKRRRKKRTKKRRKSKGIKRRKSRRKKRRKSRRRKRTRKRR